MKTAPLLSICGALSIGCAASTGPLAGDAGPDVVATAQDGGTTALPACSWPTSLDGEPGDGRCHAKRHHLRCEGASSTGGVTVLCISNDPTRCAGAESSLPDVALTCRDLCAPQEYGLVCGRVGPGGSAMEPPPGCTDRGITPGGARLLLLPLRSLTRFALTTDRRRVS